MSIRKSIFLIGLLALMSNLLWGAKDPVDWTLNESFPNQVYVGGAYSAQYTFKNQLPLTLAYPLVIAKNSSSSEFSYVDQCTGKKLLSNETCTVDVLVAPVSPGFKTVSLIIQGYDKNQVPLPQLSATAITFPGPPHTIGGQILGLGSGGTVVLLNNGADPLIRNADGSFTFANPLPFGSTYNVTVRDNPPNQICTPSNNKGKITNADVTNVVINCGPPLYTVGGQVSGLTGGGLILLINGGDALPLNADGSFTFTQGLPSGRTYNVTVQDSPANQTCEVSSGDGTINNADVTNVLITCGPKLYTVGGQVIGLTAGSLTLLNNGGDQITQTADGSFTFSQALPFGSSYNVSLQNNQPVPGLFCEPSDNQGTINTNVTDVMVNCSTTAYSVGGTVTGLGVSEFVVLQLNSEDNLTVFAVNPNFTFPFIPQGANYKVTVLTPPPGKNCTVSNGVGTNIQANVTNVNVICSITSYSVAGTISGLSPGETVDLVNDGVELKDRGNGAFIFPNLADGATYDVQVSKEPITKACTVTNESGTISGANVINVDVTCVSQPAILTASVTDLALSVTGHTEYEYGITSGRGRIITITNNGPNSANGISYNPSGLPSGTTYSVCPGNTIAANGGICTITITPGTTPNSNGTTPCNNGNGSAPLPGKLVIGGTNSNSVEIAITVLDYGCIYKGGYIYSFNDTVPLTASVQGKVAATSDSVINDPWNSFGFNVPIYGISEISTASSPNPSVRQVAGQLSSIGAVDGKQNTNNIFLYYNSILLPLSSYVAGVCKQPISNYSDWYLPAICELGSDFFERDLCGTVAAPRMQNMLSILFSFPGNSIHWSSTEYSVVPEDYAYIYNFSQQRMGALAKFSFAAVRCSRVF